MAAQKTTQFVPVHISWPVFGKCWAESRSRDWHTLMMARTKILLKGDFKKQIKDSRYVGLEAAAKV